MRVRAARAAMRAMRPARVAKARVAIMVARAAGAPDVAADDYHTPDARYAACLRSFAVLRRLPYAATIRNMPPCARYAMPCAVFRATPALPAAFFFVAALLRYLLFTHEPPHACYRYAVVDDVVAEVRCARVIFRHFDLLRHTIFRYSPFFFATTAAAAIYDACRHLVIFIVSPYAFAADSQLAMPDACRR